MSSFSKVLRFPGNGDPLLFVRTPLDERREIAIEQISECLGGAIQLIELAESRRCEFALNLSEFRIEEAKDDLLRVLGQLAQIIKGER